VILHQFPLLGTGPYFLLLLHRGCKVHIFILEMNENEPQDLMTLFIEMIRINYFIPLTYNIKFV
jgi:hypothetical protein